MVRMEISLFLKNVPGELGRLSALLGENGINIDALTIQDASAYVQQLFQARGKSLQRIASAASYNSIRKDSAEFALIRILVKDTDRAVNLLSEHDYIFDVMPVIALQLQNRPGELAAVTPSASSSSAPRTSSWPPRSSSDPDGRGAGARAPALFRLASVCQKHVPWERRSASIGIAATCRSHTAITISRGIGRVSPGCRRGRPLPFCG